jgi:hypothetical protein
MRCRAPGRATRLGASLSGTAGAYRRARCTRRCKRCHRAPDCPMAVRAPRPAIRHREPSGRRHQCRHRGSHSGARRRLHAPHRRQQCRDQRNPVSIAQLQFHPRHRADREHRPRSPAHAGESVASSPERSRVHRLCEGQSRQDRDGLGRQGFTGTCRRRIFQADDRHRSDACPLSWCCTGGDRSDRRANPGGVHRDGNVTRTRQGRQAARAGGDDRHPLGGAAGHSDAPRVHPGFRGEPVDRARCTQGHATADHRQAQHRDQRRPGRSQGEGAVRRPISAG